MKRTLGFILIVFIGFVLIAGCTEEQTSGEELKIGVVASMTGPASTTGKDIWQSAQLAADGPSNFTLRTSNFFSIGFVSPRPIGPGSDRGILR